MRPAGFLPAAAASAFLPRTLRPRAVPAVFLLLFYNAGSRLLSHAVPGIVSSAACVLTIVFGMGTGVPRRRIATSFLRHRRQAANGRAR